MKKLKTKEKRVRGVSQKSSSSPFLQPLSPKEKGVLSFIENHYNEKGFIPSYKEIQSHFGWSSINSVQNFLKQLARKKYIKWIPNQKRALQLIHPLSSPAHSPPPESRISTPFHWIQIPLLGDVAAGAPIESYRWEESIAVPEGLLERDSHSHSSYFALKVQGESMMEEGILDGDIVLVHSQKAADSGQIVVAIINSHSGGLREATLKRIIYPKYSKVKVSSSLRKDTDGFSKENDGEKLDQEFDGKMKAEKRVENELEEHAERHSFSFESYSEELRIELRPSNRSYTSQWYSSEEIEVLGVVKALLRKYT